ncbi:hypothetical protein CBG04_07855 [Limosilactobacillus reuteri]|nr:hypothetical protein CBG11_10515 [Limosilactobacillus reuteri]OYS82694.1 hypothetical protein CBG04_07855 [Limosilactobacillus reuteri]OYS84340.1 hypothetical protein CBG14_05640 [Limosilactobacillus reuteri]
MITMKNRIRECRKAVGMTLDDLAKLTKENRSSINYWERNVPPIIKLKNLLKPYMLARPI